MIMILNPSRLTAHPFFQELINYLDKEDSVTLRDIKRKFSSVTKIDRLIEKYIKAGYISRENKRYRQQLPLLKTTDGLQLDQEIFVRKDSTLFQELMDLQFETSLSNTTNQAVLYEKTDFLRDKLTLSNYFYKLSNNYSLSRDQQKLYAILGDVNPEYALKYMTNFLLKYIRKDQLLQKRQDIFIDSLVLLGYIVVNPAGKYELAMKLNPEDFSFRAS